MSKQTLLKELQIKKQRITSADVKKQNDLKRKKCNNLSTTPVKWKRKYTNVCKRTNGQNARKS